MLAHLGGHFNARIAHGNSDSGLGCRYLNKNFAVLRRVFNRIIKQNPQQPLQQELIAWREHICGRNPPIQGDSSSFSQILNTSAAADNQISDVDSFERYFVNKIVASRQRQQRVEQS